MKLYHMESEFSELTYIVKFEDTFEDNMYDNATNDYSPEEVYFTIEQAKVRQNNWDEFEQWLLDNLGVSDSEVYIYLMSSETELDIGKVVTFEGVDWKRID